MYLKINQYAMLGKISVYLAFIICTTIPLAFIKLITKITLLLKL